MRGRREAAGTASIGRRRSLGLVLVLATAAVTACSSSGGSGTATTKAPTTTAPARTTTSSTLPVTTTPSTTVATPLPIVVDRWNNGTYTLADGAVTQDWGVVAAPDGPGPYPVALVLHGNHGTCPTDTGGRTWPCPPGTERAHQEGLVYLANALAARGFVVVAPGVNVQYTLGAGEPAPGVRTVQIADHTLSALAAGRLGVDPAKVDLDRLVLVGHSMGGEDAGLMASGRAAFDHKVSGVVMLQPSLNSAGSLPLADVPTAIVVSECDGDTGVVGGRFLADALLAQRAKPAAVIALEGANHNFTNAGLGPDAFPVKSPGCVAGKALTADAQRDLLARTVPELAHAVLGDGGGTGWAGIVFDEPLPPDGVQLAVVKAAEPVAPVPGPGAGVPPTVQLNGMQATFCPIGYYTPKMAPGTEACHRPELPLLVGLPQTLALSWDAPGASLRVPLSALPDSTLRLRVVADPADARLKGPIRLRITTPEGTSRDVEVPVPDVVVEEVPPFTLTHGLLLWTTATMPLPSGASSVTLEVLSPAAGSMQLVSLGAD